MDHKYQKGTQWEGKVRILPWGEKHFNCFLVLMSEVLCWIYCCFIPNSEKELLIYIICIYNGSKHSVCGNIRQESVSALLGNLSVREEDS